MSKTIWKFDLQLTDNQYLAMPKGARILDLQVRKGRPYIWAEVDTEEVTEKRYFTTYSTGGYIKSEDEEWRRSYIGTFRLEGGHHSFHVYEDIEVEK
jgi:hypothetical protein